MDFNELDPFFWEESIRGDGRGCLFGFAFASEEYGGIKGAVVNGLNDFLSFFAFEGREFFEGRIATHEALPGDGANVVAEFEDGKAFGDPGRARAELLGQGGSWVGAPVLTEHVHTGVEKFGLFQGIEVFAVKVFAELVVEDGVGALDIDGRDTSKAMTHSHRLERSAHIRHDLAVQAAVLKRQHDYDEVIWDQHIQIPEQFEKPDALLRGPKGYWVALEY